MSYSIQYTNIKIDGTEPLEPVRQLDKKDIRIRTRKKIPVDKGWTEENHQEKLTITELLASYGEYGLRTGTKIGNYWFCVLDIDRPGWTKLIRNKRLSYVKTRQGFHLYLKIGGKQEPRKEHLSYQGQRIGDLLGQGQQAVGVGSKHPSGICYEWKQRGKWFWKLESVENLKEELAKFDVELKFYRLSQKK